MFKKYLALGLTVLIINLSFGAIAFAGTKEEKVAEFAQKVKTEINKLGVGKDAKVLVKLKDGTKIKGYITETNDNSFNVMNAKTGTVNEVPYPNVKQVKGNSLSTGAKIAIGVAIGVGVAIILGFIGQRVD
jgi:hypothetical protein